jgi:hypothetical protein
LKCWFLSLESERGGVCWDLERWRSDWQDVSPARDSAVSVCDAGGVLSVAVGDLARGLQRAKRGRGRARAGDRGDGPPYQGACTRVARASLSLSLSLSLTRLGRRHPRRNLCFAFPLAIRESDTREGYVRIRVSGNCRA